MPPQSTTTRSAEYSSSAEELLLRAHNATRGAAIRLRHQVVLDHVGLATSIAHRYSHRGPEQQDLEQVALLGLVQAVRRYQPGHAHGFLAFAVPTITGELKRYFRDHGWAVRPPREWQERSLAVRSCLDTLAQELGRDPSRADIAEALDLTVQDVERALAVDAQYVARSMDAPVDRDGPTSFSDTLGAIPSEFQRIEDCAELRSVLRNLKPREQLILRLRFVDNLTQRQIGQRIGVSQMQVSRILAAVLLHLRQTMGREDDINAAS